MPSVQLVGSSEVTGQLQQEIAAAARSDAKVLITGESGVGKEVVARLIHAESGRAVFPFVPVNCAAVAETLLEAELFGHERGSFTGAYRDRPGVLEMAHRGSVFLDEVGEMSPRMQSLLLRFLETGEIQRVGSTRGDRHVDVRVICATNRNLREAIDDKSFRSDLYYRLNVIYIAVPPLRERPGDIRILLRHFSEEYAEHYGTPPLSLSPEVEEVFAAYKWPGNVRELKNVIERLTVSHPDGKIDVCDVPFEMLQAGRPAEPVAPGKPPTESKADQLFKEMCLRRESFWSVVYSPFMSRDLTRDDVKAIVRCGLQHTSGNYRALVEMFNMAPQDYKRFLGFLRKHQCHMDYQQFRRGVRAV
jgi:transcriptional regulator with PAS, ATPase and Fis domain